MLSLEAFSQRLTVNPRGGGLARYTLLGPGPSREVLLGYDLESEYEGAMGDVLSPFPNRVRDSRYADGLETREINGFYRKDGHSVHAFVREIPWELTIVEGAIEARCDLAADRFAAHGFPYSLRYLIRYQLEQGGLTVRSRVSNEGGARAPFGLGFHPYLALAGKIDDAMLELSASELHKFNETLDGLAPMVPPSRLDLDFSAARRVGDHVINGCYGGLPRDAKGLAWITMAEPSHGRKISMFQDGAFPYVQIYTGEVLVRNPRGGLAVEPSTVTPFAFNGDGFGARWLAPGEAFTGTWGIRVVS
jgi:aldose 1-epimerase